MDSRKALLPALLAVGSGMAASTASALELGEINVESALGQPLRASVAYALQPNEQLGNYCISLAPAMAAGGIPSINTANVSVADGLISLTGRSIINEPMATLRLDINCPYAPHLVREFMLFLDPASNNDTAVVRTPATAAPVRAQATATSSVNATAQRRSSAARQPARTPESVAPIDSGKRYRVQPGDTVSEIAQRIDGRTVRLWTAVNEIFSANPGAFINDDPNLLKAGTWITIPASARGRAAVQTGNAVQTAASDIAAPTAAANVVSALPKSAQTAVATTLDTAATEPATPSVDVTATTLAVEPVAVTPADSAESLETGDYVIDAETVPEPAAAAPVDTDEGSSSWSWWFGGGALLLVGGLFLFGRRRAMPPRTDVIAEQASKPKRYLSESPKVEVVETRVPSSDSSEVDFELADDSPTEENLILGADLGQETDIETGVDVDLSAGFSFAGTTALDLELPADAAIVQDEDEWRTDGQDDTIDQEITVEQEAVNEPTAEEYDDDDYDMSVIVDATKVVDDGEVTGRDLQAVVVEDGEPLEDSGNDGYTISQEVDYDIVVQDYEDELSATQALNAEIERASAELGGEDGADDATAHLASVTPIDATASLTRDENATVLQFDDETAEMPHAGDDEDADEITSEMPVKSGKGS